MDNLRTGDLILFDTKNSGIMNIFDSLIKYFTGSKFNHIAMVIKDPHFANPELNGLYVWESGWEAEPDPQDGKYKLGVQITPLTKILKNNNGTAYIRKIICDDKLYEKTFTNENLEKIHKVVKDKPYDIYPVDWAEAIVRYDSSPKKTDRFWCSAFVGYIYNKLDIMNQSIDWSVLRPSDFSLEDKMEHLDLLDGFKLNNEQTEILCD